MFHSVSIMDFDKWATVHVDELKECPIPSVGFHCPAILQDPNDKGMIELYRSGLAQDAVRESFACSLRLTFYEPGEFSVIDLGQ